MKIVLLKNVDKLGNAGKIVETKDGYARHLISSGQAAFATQNEIQKSKDRQSSKEYSEQVDYEDAKKIFDLINDEVVDMSVRAGDNKKLHESITNAKISDFMSDKFKVQIPKNKIRIENENNRISSFGSHDVSIHLFKNIVANVHVNIIQENI